MSMRDKNILTKMIKHMIMRERNHFLYLRQKKKRVASKLSRDMKKITPPKFEGSANADEVEA